MIFVFEDDRSDVLCRIFHVGYSTIRANEFIYDEGNGNIKNTVVRLLTETKEKIVVFLDMSPGNREIVNIYHYLKMLSRREEWRLIVLPVMCREYYFIRSLINEPVFESRAGIEACVNKQPYFDSELIETDADRKFCRNFEKFCKLILIKNVIDCVRHSRNMEKSNRLYGYYYEKDCVCPERKPSCKEKLLLEKSRSFLKEFPCVPDGSLFEDVVVCNAETIWMVHRRLVTEFNEMVMRFKIEDKENAAKYKKIPPYR